MADLSKMLLRICSRFTAWGYVVIVLTTVFSLSSCGSEAAVSSAGTETTERVTTPEPNPEAAVETTLDLPEFSSRSWEPEVDVIVASDASPTTKVDQVSSLVKNYAMTEADVVEQTSYLVEQVQSRAIIDQAADKQFMHRLVFTAFAVGLALDNADGRPEDEFAFDLWQVARDLARESEAPDSQFIQANLDQLDDAIAENDW